MHVEKKYAAIAGGILLILALFCVAFWPKATTDRNQLTNDPSDTLSEEGFRVPGGIALWDIQQEALLEDVPLTEAAPAKLPQQAVPQPTEREPILQPAASVLVLSGNIKADDLYSPTLQTYEKWRMQFVGCNPTPRQFLVKSGRTILVDNASADTQTLTIDGQRLTLGPRDARIVQLNADEQRDFTIHCSHAGVDRFNVASITVVP